jgi:hypothetical protein
MAALAAVMRGMPADQLLDLAIAKLRSMLPNGPVSSGVAFSPMMLPIAGVVHDP